MIVWPLNCSSLKVPNLQMDQAVVADLPDWNGTVSERLVRCGPPQIRGPTTKATARVAGKISIGHRPHIMIA